MVNRMKRFCSLLLALAMSVTLCTAAVSASSSNAVITIDGEEVSASEFAYYISYYVDYYGADEDDVLSYVIDQTLYVESVFALAEDYDIVDDDAAEAYVAEEWEDFVADYGTEEAVLEALETEHCTKAIYTRLLRFQYYYDQLYSYFGSDTLVELYNDKMDELSDLIVYGDDYENIDVTAEYPYGLTISESTSTVDWTDGVSSAGWGATFAVVLIGLLVVFCILVLLVFVVWLFGKIIAAIQDYAHKAKAPKTAAPKPAAAVPPQPKKPAAVPAPAPAKPDGIPAEVVAAITAAIACMTAGSGKSYKVKRIQRTGNPRSAWSAAGVMDNTRPF